MRMTINRKYQCVNFRGQIAVVTVGATGIEGAIALKLAEKGASVMIADINQYATAQTFDGACEIPAH